MAIAVRNARLDGGVASRPQTAGARVLLARTEVLGAIVLGLAARPLLSLELRRQHNDVAAAIFSVIGVTFAVLLAFVAMVVWQHYNAAKATSYKPHRKAEFQQLPPPVMRAGAGLHRHDAPRKRVENFKSVRRWTERAMTTEPIASTA
jgi:hypothetical protein